MTGTTYLGSEPQATTAPAPSYPYLEARLIRRYVPGGGAAHSRQAIGPIQSPLGVGFTESLYDAGTGEVTAPLEAQDEHVRAALGGIATTPVEIHFVYATGEGQARTWKGPVIGWQQTRVGEAGLGLRLKALGLGHYLEGLPLPTRGATPGRFTATAEAVTDIAIDAVAGAQADGDYSHFGIEIAAAGGPVPVDDIDLPTYTPVMQLLRSMAEQAGTLDVTVETGPDPDGEAPPLLRLDYPRRGADRTAGVIIDRRSILEPAWALGAGLDDFATQVRAVGNIDGAEVVDIRTNTAAEAAWGRRALPIAAGSDIITAAALGRFADQALTARRHPAVLAAPTLAANPALEITAFGLGDTIEIDYDPGIGLAFAGAYRVHAYTVTFDDTSGAASIDLAVVPDP